MGQYSKIEHSEGFVPKYGWDMSPCPHMFWYPCYIYKTKRSKPFFKTVSKAQEASSILRVGFALWPHSDRVYLLGVRHWSLETVSSLFLPQTAPHSNLGNVCVNKMWDKNPIGHCVHCILLHNK